MPQKAISISVDLARKATVTIVDKISFCGRSEYTPDTVTHPTIRNGGVQITGRRYATKALFDNPAGLELELVSNSSSSLKLTLALEVFG
jgi:hypothetical protein